MFSRDWEDEEFYIWFQHSRGKFSSTLLWEMVMSLQVLAQDFQNEWSPDNALSLWKQNHCNSLWFSFLSGRKKKCCHAVLQPRDLPTLVDTDWHRHGSFCCLVTWFGREWMNSSVLGSFCAWNISVDVVVDVSYWMKLLSWTKVVMLKAAGLLF